MSDTGTPLSEREQEVLQLVVTGATNLQMARELMISPNTVKVHLRNIYEKMGVQSRTEASMVALREGWISLEGAEAELRETTTRAPATRVAPWQRWYLVCALVITLVLFLYPYLISSRSAPVPQDEFRDPPLVLNSADVVQPADQWTARAPMPVSRSRLAVVAVGERVYAVGGATSEGPTGMVEVYDPSSNGWLPGSPKPTAVTNIAAATVDGLIYVPGGLTSDGRVTDALEVYDPRQDRWQARSTMPHPVCAYAAAASGGRLYIFGGWDGERYGGWVQVYDPPADAWTEGTPTSHQRGFGAAAELEGLIYFVGGFDGEEPLSVVEVYDPAQEHSGDQPWSTRASMTVPRAGLGLAAAGADLYALGGGWRDGVAYNERYDPAADGWSSFASPMPVSWRHLGAASVSGRIFALGGWAGGHLSTNEEYATLFYRIHLPLGEKSETE